MMMKWNQLQVAPVSMLLFLFLEVEAIRVEVVMAAKNYITQRINIEQEELIQKCITLLSAKTMNDFVSHGRTIVRVLFPGEVEQFSDDVCN